MYNLIAFKSKPEAYSYALFALINLSETIEDNPLLNDAIAQIKIAIENHEQNYSLICQYLQNVIDAGIFEKTDINKLTTLIQIITSSPYIQTLEEKFSNPLGRRIESELPALLLENPTKAMMYAVERVSKQIVLTIMDIEKNGTLKEKVLIEKFAVIV